jgi:putative PIN family toxin of toxin-antitoxin system
VSGQRVVLDTNVVVSALLNSFGPPARVLDLALAGELIVAYDDRVFAEWREVLGREIFGFSPADVGSLLALVEGERLGISPPPLGVELPDPDDLPFLEVAREAGATLVTGNTKHYPPDLRRGVEVIGPAEFLEGWVSEGGQGENT